MLNPNALTTVAQVRSIYPTLATDFPDDTDIEYLINIASGFIEQYCNRVFVITTKLDTLDGNCKDLIYLKQYPIVTINEVLLDSTDITVDVTEGTTEDDKLSGAIFYEDYFISGRRGLKVNYDHGYETRVSATLEADITLPTQLENLCLRIINNIADDILSQNAVINDGGSGNPRKLRGFSITDVKWSFGENTGSGKTARSFDVSVAGYLTPGEQNMLDQYRERSI